MSSTNILHQAIVNRDVATIKRILKEEDGCKATDDDGETVLHLAFKCKDRIFFRQESIVETLECFLSEGLSIAVKNAAGRTVLFSAVENRLRHVTDFLVHRGANIHARDRNGNTIVHLLIKDQSRTYSSRGLTSQEFIKQEDIIFVNWLLSTGVNVHLRNNDGKTASNLAIRRNLKHIVPTLIKHMNDDNYIVEDGSTIIKSLFQLNANINTKYDVEIVESLLVFVDKVDKKGNTLVHTFLKTCGRNSEIIQRVLLWYTNVNAQDQDGNTALHLVLRNYFSYQYKRHAIDAVRTLLCKGANVNLKNHAEDTAVHLAVRGKQVEVLKTLLEYGADVSPSTHPGALFLHDISHVPSTKDEVWAPLVDALVSAGWNVNAVRPDDHFSPLMEACRSSCPAIAQKLIDNGANVNYAEKRNLSRPIHITAMASSAKQSANTAALIKMLAKAGAMVNVKNKRGETALHLAAHCGYSTVRRLLKLGAHVDARDNAGRLPLHEAAKEESIGAIKALLQFGAEVNDPGVLTELNKLLMIEQVDDEIQILPGPNFNFVTQEKKATVDCLTKHWLKLKAANLSVIDGYADFTKKESLQQFYIECLREVETLKAHHLNDRTLYDLLHMDVNLKYVFIAKRLKELVKSPLLITNFPKYHTLISACYIKALARYPLIEPAKRAWDYLTGIRLPDCVEQILVHLSNEDLRVMAEEVEEINSLKRLLRLTLGEPTKRKRLE